MKGLKSLAWIAAPFTLLFISLSIANAKVECQPGQHYMCIKGKNNEEDCKCLRNMQMPAPMLAKYIQDKEGVDKSQIVNLDKVLQKAVEESAQKANTPIKFTVKVQTGENTPPKEVEYQITTSR